MKQIKKYNQCLRDPNPQIRINTIYYYAKQAGVKLPHTSQYAPFPHGAETAQTAQTAQTTVVERFPINALFSVKRLLEVLSSVSSVSVIIR